MIEITTDGKRILCRFAYDRKLVNQVKTVPGARWHSDTKTWRFPLTMDTCRMFRKVFGDQLKVLPALTVWAKAETEKESSMEKFREGAKADLGRVSDKAPRLRNLARHSFSRGGK